MSAANNKYPFGTHPFTGQLLAHLQHSRDGLEFTDTDLDLFRCLGERLGPEALHAWLRDLWVLVVTLRNDLGAHIAASQLQAGLIDPLCLRLDAQLRAPLVQTRREAALH